MCITEGIPQKDEIRVCLLSCLLYLQQSLISDSQKQYKVIEALKSQSRSRLVGPNCPGSEFSALDVTLLKFTTEF